MCFRLLTGNFAYRALVFHVALCVLIMLSVLEFNTITIQKE